MCINCGKQTLAVLDRDLIKLPKVLIISFKRLIFSGKMRKILDRVEYEENINLQPLLDTKYEKDKVNKCSTYQLMAIIVHKGKLKKGRYMAYVKKENNQWYLADNEQVTGVTIEDVLEQEPYLMFYSRVQV